MHPRLVPVALVVLAALAGCARPDSRPGEEAVSASGATGTPSAAAAGASTGDASPEVAVPSAVPAAAPSPSGSGSVAVAVPGPAVAPGAGSGKGEATAPGAAETASSSSEPPEAAGAQATPSAPGRATGAAAAALALVEGSGGRGKEGGDVSAQGGTSPPLAAGCRAALTRLRALRARIPFVFLDLSRKPAEIDSDIKAAIALAESFLSRCPKASEVSWVEAWLSRDLLSRYQRYQVDFRKLWLPQLKDSGLEGRELEEELKLLQSDEMAAYRQRLEGLAADAREKAESGTEANRIALGVLADLAAKKGDFEGQIRLAGRLIREYPDAPFRSKYTSDVGRAYFQLSRYRESVEFLRGAIEKHRDDPEYVLYNAILFESLNGTGDLEGMEAMMRRIRREYPERLESIESSYLKGQYAYWADVSGFWIAFVRYALGDLSGATEALEENVRLLDEKEKRLSARGEKLSNITKIYRDFRMRDVLGFLQRYQGKKPERDFDEGVKWLGEKSVTIAGAKGSVVPVLFRIPGDLRSSTFLIELDGLTKRLEKVQGMTLGFLPSRYTQEQARQRADKLQEELSRLDVELPAGFDTTPGQKIFRSLHATVGTASFIVFDAEGKFAWYLMDPKDMDRRILERVLTRLNEAAKAKLKD